MANIIYRGTNDPQLQYFEINFDPNKGSTVNKEFKGTNFTKMAALANQYGANRWTGTLRSEYGVATLKLSGTNTTGLGITSPVTDITDKWEISVDQERPDLCENPNFKAVVGIHDAGLISISDNIFQILRDVASSEQKTLQYFWSKCEKTVATNIYGVELSGGLTVQQYIDSGMDKETLVRFVLDYLRGVTTFARGKYVLRHVTNAPSDYNTNIADFNVERIYTIAQLLSECEDSGLWIYPLPGYLAYKISAYVPTINIPANYQWGALKLRSSATTAANNRIEISTEYLIDAWPKHTYGTI